MKKKILLLIFVLTAIFDTLSTQVVTSFVMPDSIFSGSIYPTIKDLVLDKNNNVWVATIGGLAKLNSNYEVEAFYKQENSGLPHFFCQALAVDTTNHIWIGTAGEPMAEFDQNTTWLIHDPYYDVIGIKISENNNVWFHSWNSGVAYFDGINFEWYNTQNSSIPSDDIYDIEIQNDSVIWIATINQGLVRYSNNEFEIFDTLNSEISSNVIYGIEIDMNNKLYCGTDKGLCIYEGDQWQEMQELNDNLQIEKCQPVFVDDDNYVWITSFNNNSDQMLFKMNGENIDLLNLPDNQYFIRPDRVHNNPILAIGNGKYITYSQTLNSGSIIEFDFSSRVQNNNYNHQVHVFPVPAFGDIFIISRERDISNIKIFTLGGVILEEHHLENLNTYSINLSNFKPGLYWLYIEYVDQSFEIKSVSKI